MTDNGIPGDVVPIFDGAAGQAIEDAIEQEAKALLYWPGDDRLNNALRDLKNTLGIT